MRPHKAEVSLPIKLAAFQASGSEFRVQRLKIAAVKRFKASTLNGEP